MYKIIESLKHFIRQFHVGLKLIDAKGLKGEGSLFKNPKRVHVASSAIHLFSGQQIQSHVHT